MPAHTTLTKFEDIPCCPELDTEPICDVLDFRRRLVFPSPVRGPQEQPVKVEVVIHTRFTRCSGPLALGDIAYTTTLLPGEKVRLATTDRRSRFSFDSESKLSYRSEQISEEQYRLRALRAFMSDENVVDRGRDNYSELQRMRARAREEDRARAAAVGSAEQAAGEADRAAREVPGVPLLSCR